MTVLMFLSFASDLSCLPGYFYPAKCFLHCNDLIVLLIIFLVNSNGSHEINSATTLRLLRSADLIRLTTESSTVSQDSSVKRHPTGSYDSKRTT